MIVSTFELLINKKQFPKVDDLPQEVQDNLSLTEENKKFLKDLSREVIQGYFLTITNLTNTVTELVISFIGTDFDDNNLSIDPKDIAALFDFSGENTPAILEDSSAGFRLDYSVKVPGNITGQLVVQANPKLIFDSSEAKELRGYVRIATKDGSNVSLLLTPEHRATFYRRNADIDDPLVELDQVAYALPTATGSSMFMI